MARSSSATYCAGANVSVAVYALEDAATADALESFCFAIRVSR
jgi:hypothetical protein